MLLKLIPLINCDKVALVDDEDYAKLSEIEWRFFDNYAISKSNNKDGKMLRMHREIMNCDDSNILVDHIDGNTLNNRRSNLRVCNRSQNMMNARGRKRPDSTSVFKGVRFLKKHGYYQARIQVNKRPITIGHFTNEFAAANAYNLYAEKYHGDFARLNVVDFMDEKTFRAYEISGNEKGRIHYD